MTFDNETCQLAYDITTNVLMVVTGIFAALWPVLRKLRSLNRKIDTLADTSLKRALEMTRDNAVKVAASADPSKVHTLDLRFPGDIYVSIGIIMGKSYSPFPGLEMTGLYSDRDSTHYSLATQQAVTLLRHHHEERETLTVVQGSATDLDSGRIYRTGESWDISPTVDHRVFFEAHSLFLVAIRPPLPLASARPVNVEQLPRIAELE